MKQKAIVSLSLIAVTATFLAGCASSSPSAEVVIENATSTSKVTPQSAATTQVEVPPTTPTGTPKKPAALATPAVIAATDNTYSLAEVAKHNSETDCWMAIDGNVYDVTSFIASGAHNAVITEGCGLDASAMFQQQEKHVQSKAQDLMTQFRIGSIK